MREILFRGKRTDDGKWMCGNLTVWSDGSVSIDRAPTASSPMYAVIPETVGQYTGLTDKNGKKIFEGDIVNVNTNKDTLCHRYEGRNLVIRYDEYHRFVASGRLEYPLCNHYEWEVIGNIHDNPELLEVGNNA